MKFVPKGAGTVKLLLQQPELEESLAGEDPEPFDLEIGLYDP